MELYGILYCQINSTFHPRVINIYGKSLLSTFDDRFKQIFERLCAEDFSTGLTLICPLIDRAGKKLYGLKKPGERFKKILSDNNDFLYWMMTDGLIVMAEGADFIFIGNGKENVDLSQAIYKLVRNSLLHEAEISEKIEFINEGRVGYVGDKIVFPKTLIFALAFMLSYLPCYENDCPRNYKINVSGVTLPLQDVWGNKEKIKKFFECEIFRR